MSNHIKADDSFEGQTQSSDKKPRVFNPYENSGLNMKNVEMITNVGVSISKGFISS